MGALLVPVVRVPSCARGPPCVLRFLCSQLLVLVSYRLKEQRVSEEICPAHEAMNAKCADSPMLYLRAHDTCRSMKFCCA